MPYDLTPELRKIALDALRAYLKAPPIQDGRTPVEIEAELDVNRVTVIESTLRSLLIGYLAKSFSVVDFKRQIDGVNKQNQHWGFSGIKGQMFFNMLVKVNEDLSQLDDQLRSAIREPKNDDDAAKSLRKFNAYVVQLGKSFVDGGGEPRSKPKPSSIPFFLSYFWQIQDPDIWPVYYTSTVQMIETMNLWQATGEIGEDYLTYKRLHKTLAELFSEEANRKFTLYDVEHVFWFKSGRSLAGPEPHVPKPGPEKSPTLSDQSFDSYIPPIVAIIPRLASNDPELQEMARQSGTTLDRAFEKSINAAFTVLGYETLLLGQGKGRVPDGQAIAGNESYALLWDAKARSDSYRMGTDDRIIRQYIDSESKKLKHRGIRNIYYLIISKGFADDFEDSVRSLKMDTNVNEVCLVEAAALVAIVNQRLRSPLSIGLGADGIQRLFSSSGIITASDVLENLAGA